jgi:hypothetical protein
MRAGRPRSQVSGPRGKLAPGSDADSFGGVIRFAALLVLGTQLNLAAAVFRAGNWSVDVSVAPEKPVIMLGEPTWLAFTVRNLTTEPLQILVGGDYRNDLGRPNSFQVRTTRSDGKWVSQPDVGLGTGGLVGPKDLPASGTYVFRLFVPHWATLVERGTYSIACRRTLNLLRPGTDFRKEPTVDVDVDAKTTLQVDARDDERMGELVRGWGDTMLRADGGKEGDDAVLALAWVNDPRVVPYFRRALSIRSFALKFIAVQALAKFSTDEALEGLKSATQARVTDFDYALGEQRPELAANLRAAAAGALSRCPHPRAKEFLVAQRHDESENVRVAVVHALSRIPSAQALPLLQEMSRDPSPRVSEEAKRYVAKLWRTPEPGEPKKTEPPPTTKEPPAKR